jgi:hypothetical protein
MRPSLSFGVFGRLAVAPFDTSMATSAGTTAKTVGMATAGEIEHGRFDGG